MRKVMLGCGAVAVGLLLFLLLLGAGAAGYYNRLVGLEEGVDSAWAQVENVYQRRADLIPNLVEVVQGARDFERETFVAVTEARAKVGQVQISGAPDGAQLRDFEAAQGGLSSALSRLLVAVERYPDLRATESFRDLQAQLEGSENRIAVERRRFNEAARDFNTARRSFPTSLIASLRGFDDKPYFEAQEGASEVPPVDLRQGR